MYKHNNSSKRKIVTLNGKLEIKRTKLYDKEQKVTVIPKDEYLDIHKLPYKMTVPAMEQVSFIGQNEISFKASSELLEKFLGIEISASNVRKVTEYVGEAIYKADKKEAEKKYDDIVKLNIKRERKDVILYVMVDGAAVNTRVEDENGSTWRECKSAIAFTNKDILKRKDGSSIILKKECISIIGKAEELKKNLLMIAILKGYETVGKTVILSDGATWIRNICKEVFPDALQILDLFHLKENIYSYAKYVYPVQKEYTKYAETLINYIEQGKKDKAIKKIKEPEEKLPIGIVNIKNYIKNNYDKIDYPEYIKKGYYIGSGAMESANKVLVQRRLKQAGMRWSVEKSQTIVSLRAKAESKRWNDVMPIIYNKIEEDYLKEHTTVA